MTSTANEIVVQSQAGVTHDVEALVQAAVSVLTNDIQIATHDQGTGTSQHDQNTVQLLVDTCATNHIQDRLYMCTDCNLAFYGEQGEQDWQWHLRQHKPFKCDLCSEAFEQKESLKTHMRSHTMQMPFICDKCGSAYTLKSNLVQHMKVHEDNLYQCAECNVVFKTQVNLEKHLKFHTGETIKVFQCEHCSKTFSQQKNLVQHMKIHMGGDKTYKCSECPASYSYKCHLTRHLMIHTGDKPYKCKFCGKSFNRNAHLIRHRKIHSGMDKEWKCTTCGFAFWEKSDLIRHIKSHEGNRPFKCDFCDQTFVWKRYLLKHLNNHHRADDRHFCQDCCQCFPTFDELAEHDAKEHSNKKQLTHTCDICNQEFYFKYKLDEHMFIHTGRKAHSCDKCQQKFVSRKELDRHIAEHAQEVSFRCNTCEKTFSSINQLQQHVKLHTGDGKYPCSICGASYRWKSQLTSHMVVHSTDYDFTCSVCTKQFKRKRDLTRHVKIYHDTKPPYTCVECNQDFHSPYNLHKHKADTHWRRIDGTDEFPCKHCSGVFRIKPDLDRHQSKVHPPRPFVCTLCSKRFTMMKFLEKHFELKHEGVEMIEEENFEIRNAVVKVEEEINMDLEVDERALGEQEDMDTEQKVTEVIGEGTEQVIVFENIEELNQGEEFRELEKVSLEHAAAHGAGGDGMLDTSNDVKQELNNSVSIADIDMQEQPLSEAITLAHLSQQTGPVYLQEVVETNQTNLGTKTVYKLPNKSQDGSVGEQIVICSSVPTVQPVISQVTSLAQISQKKPTQPKIIQVNLASSKLAGQSLPQMPQIVPQGQPGQPRVIKIQTKAAQPASTGLQSKVQQINIQKILKAAGSQGNASNIKIIPALPTTLHSLIQSSQAVAAPKVAEPAVSTIATEAPVLTYGDSVAVDAQLLAGLMNSEAGGMVSEQVITQVSSAIDQTGFTSPDHTTIQIVQTEEAQL